MLHPPCNCKPTNVNEYAPRKGDKAFPMGPGLSGDRIRPSRIYSFQVMPVNIIRDEATQDVHTWNSSTTQADPRVDRTPGTSHSPKTRKRRK